MDTIFSQPRMPYTVGLLGSTPRPDVSAEEPLTPIVGSPPVLVDLKQRCQFAPLPCGAARLLRRRAAAYRA